TVLSLKSTAERGRLDESGYPSTHGPRVCHVFEAFPLSPVSPSPVSRCSEAPPTMTSGAALTIVVPASEEGIGPVREPLPREVVQFDGPTKLPGPETIEKPIVVPSAALT